MRPVDGRWCRCPVEEEPLMFRERHHASIMEFENFSSVKADADNRQADLKRTTPVDAHAVLR
jgi:hypothetical protein